MVEKENFKPVNRMPNDPENAFLSKADFQTKMRKKRELDAKMKAYEEKARAEIYADPVTVPEPVVETQPEPVAVESEPPKKKKGGRPKKVQ